ncbi:MAG TPA: RDD family protein [Rhodocyclaceae bacterium]|nr:RDD family protein [Rhodocyclaceae bacterium]
MAFPVSLPPSGISRRIASMAYECLLLIGVLAGGFLLPQVIFAMISAQTAPSWLLVIHAVAIIWAYFVWFWRHGGQTLAMRTWKIRLVSAQGDAPPSLLQATSRFLLCWPSLLFFGAGIFWALLDNDRQFLHDRIVGTRLVMKNG